MNPRSSTLFHFTRGIDALKAILVEGFWPRYCLEDFSWYNTEIGHIAYPMVCFCDIPLSRINQHVAFYGEYGLGMSLEWGRKNGLNPVVYLSPTSPLTTSVRNVLTNIRPNKETHYYNGAIDTNHIISYIKPLEGWLPILSSVPPPPVPKQFYQENEWRYVPNNASVTPWVRRVDFEANDNRELFNTQTKQHCMLRFEPSDIKYIFLRSDSEIPALVDYINSALGHCTVADMKILSSRIVSLESIRNDL